MAIWTPASPRLHRTRLGWRRGQQSVCSLQYPSRSDAGATIRSRPAPRMQLIGQREAGGAARPAARHRSPASSDHPAGDFGPRPGLGVGQALRPMSVERCRSRGSCSRTASTRSPTPWTRPARQAGQPGIRRPTRPSLLPRPVLVVPRCCPRPIRSPTTHGCATRRQTGVLRGACSARCTARPEARTGRVALARADCAHSPRAHRGVLFGLPHLVRATDVCVAGRGRHAHLAPLATRQRVCCGAVDCAPAPALQATSVSTFPPAEDLLGGRLSG